jgi:hypothetical protein
MATGSFHAGSDIDFFIVVAEGHIFLTRILTTLIVHLLGIRRHGSHIAGRICMNRYAADSFLAITPANAYHARVFHNLIPLYAVQPVYETYLTENAWMEEFGYPIVRHEPIFNRRLWLQRMAERGIDPFAPLLERVCAAWQRSQAQRDVRVQQEGSVVILTPQELRFHLAKD